MNRLDFINRIKSQCPDIDGVAIDRHFADYDGEMTPAKADEYARTLKQASDRQNLGSKLDRSVPSEEDVSLTSSLGYGHPMESGEDRPSL